jgi:hypothetical protein
LELTNEFLVNKKEETITEKKKLMNGNDELKHEIEAKMQLNEIRIQKKMKENNSEVLKKLDAHLKSVNECIIDTDAKVIKEQEKSRMFISEIIKLNIALRHRQEKHQILTMSSQEKTTELVELKSKFEDLKNEHLNLKEKVINVFLVFQLKISFLIYLKDFLFFYLLTKIFSFYRLTRRLRITNYLRIDIKLY